MGEEEDGKMQKIVKQNPYISIVIPIYNVEQYLEKCLNSVLQQTYQDFELILVDDGSTDASKEICDRFASLDSRIIVIHKQNDGLVSARKAGLVRASGEFVGCVDPDDWIEKDYYDQMIQAQKETGADIVAGNHFRDIGPQSYTVPNNIPIGLYRKEDILHKMIYTGIFFEFGLHPSLCTKLIRKKILDITQMSVNEDIFCEEDGAVIYPSVLEADKILITDVCGYHYVQRQGSITKSGCEDDIRRLRLVFTHLEKVFADKGMWKDLRYQLKQWEKFIFLERHIQVFDKRMAGTILCPYGGILPNSRVVIYGASRLGQTINRYISENNLGKNVLWIDKAYENFRKQGLQINPPEDIQKLKDEYDVVLIASVTESIVHSMKEYLLKLQVPEDKMLWLTEKFICNEEIQWNS